MPEASHPCRSEDPKPSPLLQSTVQAPRRSPVPISKTHDHQEPFHSRRCHPLPQSRRPPWNHSARATSPACAALPSFHLHHLLVSVKPQDKPPNWPPLPSAELHCAVSPARAKPPSLCRISISSGRAGSTSLVLLPCRIQEIPVRATSSEATTTPIPSRDSTVPAWIHRAESKFRPCRPSLCPRLAEPAATPSKPSPRPEKITGVPLPIPVALSGER